MALTGLGEMRSPVTPSTVTSLAPGRASSRLLPSLGQLDDDDEANWSASLPESESFPMLEAPRLSSCLLPSAAVTSPPAVAGTSSTSKGRMQPALEFEEEEEEAGLEEESWAATNGVEEKAERSAAALSSTSSDAAQRLPAERFWERPDVERAIFPGMV